MRVNRKHSYMGDNASAVSFDSAVTPKSVTRIRAATMMYQTKEPTRMVKQAETGGRAPKKSMFDQQLRNGSLDVSRNQAGVAAHTH